MEIKDLADYINNRLKENSIAHARFEKYIFLDDAVIVEHDKSKTSLDYIVKITKPFNWWHLSYIEDGKTKVFTEVKESTNSNDDELEIVHFVNDHTMHETPEEDVDVTSEESYDERVINPEEVGNEGETSEENNEEVYAKGGSIDKSRIDEMTSGYMQAILFAEMDNEDQSLDSNYDIRDFSNKSVAEIKHMIRKFISENKSTIEKSGLSDEQIGMDIWYTQAGHGVGFFDRNLDKDVEEKLTKSAQDLGRFSSVEVGDDGKIHIRGIKYAKGGSVYAKGNMIKNYYPTNGRYLSLIPNANGLNIIINEEGKEELKLHEVSGEEIYLEPFFIDLFDDIRGNSEYMYFGDIGEAGFGLTSAPGITDGYYYDDNGNLTEEGNVNARVFWFPDYQIKDFVKELLDKGEVRFQSAEEMKHGGMYAHGGQIKTISELRQKNKEIGNNFFDKSSMRFFKSKIESGILYGKYFITSEQFGENNPREFKIREFEQNGKIINNPWPHHREFRTKEDAKEFLKKYEHEHSIK